MVAEFDPPIVLFLQALDLLESLLRGPASYIAFDEANSRSYEVQFLLWVVELVRDL